MVENIESPTEKILAKFLAENEKELLTMSKEDRDLAIFQEGYIAGLERSLSIMTKEPKP